MWNFKNLKIAAKFRQIVKVYSQKYIAIFKQTKYDDIVLEISLIF